MLHFPSLSMIDYLYLQLPEYDPEAEAEEEYGEEEYMTESKGGLNGWIEEGARQIKETFFPEREDAQPEKQEASDAKPKRKRKPKADVHEAPGTESGSSDGHGKRSRASNRTSDGGTKPKRDKAKGKQQAQEQEGKTEQRTDRDGGEGSETSADQRGNGADRGSSEQSDAGAE